LGGDGVEELGAGGHAEVGEFEEEFAGHAEAAVDIEGIVEVGVVDEALPADGGAGFLEVDAHDDEEVVLVLVGGGLEEFAVVEGGLGIVDGAGADHNEEAVVLSEEDVFGGLPGGGDEIGGGVGDGEVVGEDGRGDQGIDAGDAEVVCIGAGHGAKVVGEAAGFKWESGRGYQLLVIGGRG